MNSIIELDGSNSEVIKACAHNEKLIIWIAKTTLISMKRNGCK
jgi:hypothetical protein